MSWHPSVLRAYTWVPLCMLQAESLFFQHDSGRRLMPEVRLSSFHSSLLLVLFALF